MIKPLHTNIRSGIMEGGGGAAQHSILPSSPHKVTESVFHRIILPSFQSSILPFILFLFFCFSAQAQVTKKATPAPAPAPNKSASVFPANTLPSNTLPSNTLLVNANQAPNLPSSPLPPPVSLQVQTSVAENDNPEGKREWEVSMTKDPQLDYVPRQRLSQA